jgi:uncharacterized membrane protein YphA (DoxX/SURF4 family)
MCFIGHGAFGIITKKIWVNYFGVFGIGEGLAYQLMPVVGIIDIFIGVTLLIYPTRAAVAWLLFWGMFTAFLRPLAGESFAEFLERAGNYGAPMALLLITRENNFFSRMVVKQFSDEAMVQSLTRLLQFISALLLCSHGWLNIVEKQSLLLQYNSLGFSHPEFIASIVGLFEIVAAVLIIAGIGLQFVIVILLWKITSESIYLQFPVFEWIERGGSYGVLLSLAMILKHRPSATSKFLLLQPGKFAGADNKNLIT